MITRGRIGGLAVLALLAGGACASPSALPRDAPGSADAIVVLGKRPPVDRRGEISAEMRRRVDRGVQLYRAGAAPRILMTGGRTTARVEAEIMRSYALQQGVPEAAILLEDRAADTIGNARLSHGVLCAALGRGPDCRPSVMVVSTSYNLGRATPLFACAGFDAVGVPTLAPRGAWRALWYALANGSYEAGMRIAYLFRDECAAARPRAPAPAP